MQFFEQLNHLPPWTGSVPLWALFVTVLVALIKAWPKLRELTIKEKASIADRYSIRIKELAEEIRECRRLCDEQEARQLRKIEVLQDKISGMQRQHVQEQISLINAIISSVDSPQLKGLLRALESVQVALRGHVIQSQPANVIQDEGDSL